MAKPVFDSVAAQIMPALRTRDVLVAEIARVDTGRSADLARGSLAAIELAISQADADYNAGSYSAALSGFRRARGLVYRLLHPTFEVSQWLRDQTVAALPVGTAIESSLLAAGARLIATLRPEAVDVTGLPALAEGAVDDGLAAYATTGFRKQNAGDGLLESVAAQSLALMSDGKPELAVTAMREALDASPDASAHTIASTQLNLATALLQAGSTAAARTQAARAAEAFTGLEDQLGTAQAIHVQAVGASVAGDAAAAEKLFAASQKALGVPAETPAPGRTPRVGRVPLRNTVPDVGRVALSATTTAAPVLARAEAVGLDGWSSQVLDPILTQDARALTVRLPGRLEGWQVLPVPDTAARASTEAAWLVGVPTGRRIAELTVSASTPVTAADLRGQVYADRGTATRLRDLHLVAVDAASTSSYLPHLYSYSLPLRIGDALQAIGLYAQAEASYLECAQYSFLNESSEATAVWVRLASNALAWGDTLYKAVDLPGASAQYGKLVAADGTEPATSVLYSTASLAQPTAAARDVLAHLRERPMPPLQWQVAQHVLTALGYLGQITDGLDFYGLALSPIQTFEYLQDVARGFAQQSVQAEREYVNFRSRQQIEEGTRRDLETTGAMAWAEVDGRREQLLSSQADITAARAALDLAVRRRDDAQHQRDEYAASSWTQIWSQAASTAQGMGSNSWFNEISELADKLDRGESISGERGKLAAAYVLQAGRKNRLYELAKMDDNIRELTAAVPGAQAQVDSAEHRAAAAEIALQAALQRAQMADAALVAFDANEFTPAAWSAMADVMRDISRDYLRRAIRLAKLMERAYNFEHDSTLAVIKDDYGHAIAQAPGQDAVLLGGDGLLTDIDSFTYVAITTTVRKTSRLKDVVSVAAEFPAQFEQFRQTGVLSFETDVYEFDRLHPGFYQQRIEAVEIEFVGLVPAEGLNGTLTAGGVTRYRTRTGDVGERVHQVDTMALSAFVARNDLFLYQAPTGIRGLFQGLGVGSTWQLRLPRRSNDLDLRRIIDVHVVVYYTALYDVGLRATVLARPPRPGELSAVKDFNLRYDAPDAWYGFYRTSAVDFVLDAVRLPANQEQVTVNDVQLRVQPQDGVSAQGITLSVTPPGGAAASVTTDASGTADVSGEVPALAGTSPLGTWHIEMTGGPSVTDGGVVQPGRVVSMQLGLDYAFQLPVEEP